MSNRNTASKINVIYPIIISLCFITLGCGGRAAKLPNGYQLVPRDDGYVLISDDGIDVLKGSKTSDFCVADGVIYGWIDDLNDDFYAVNTITHHLDLFDSWKELDVFLERSSLPKLTIKESFNYYDVIQKKKKLTW